jgi:DNA replication and repair protein RecF
LKRNDKQYKRLAEHLGIIPLVMISPPDSMLIDAGSEERRRFMDMAISQYDSRYVEALLRYDKTLKQRNALLKQEEEPDYAVMDVLEEMMSMDAAYIYERRTEFVEKFTPIFQQLYTSLCDTTSEIVSIKYASHISRGELKGQLNSFREKERIVGYTLHGTHRDDLELFLNDYPIRQEGSQGQTKTYFIALKLAQFLYLKERGAQRTPLLLLDDIFDKLDAGRVARIIDYVSGDAFGQIFITDTNREHLDGILEATTKEYKLFHVVNGNISE